jgi:hypothetical protein
MQLKNTRFTLDALVADAKLEKESADIEDQNIKEIQALRKSFLKGLDSFNSVIIPTSINEDFNLIRARSLSDTGQTIRFEVLAMSGNSTGCQ